MQPDDQHGEFMDLERAVYDPEYRRALIDRLRAQRRAGSASRRADADRETSERPGRGAFAKD